MFVENLSKGLLEHWPLHSEETQSGARPVAWGAKQFQLRYFTKIVIMSLGLLRLTQLQNPYSKRNFKMSINLLAHQLLVNLWSLHWVSIDGWLITTLLGDFKQVALLHLCPLGLRAMLWVQLWFTVLQFLTRSLSRLADLAS